MTQPLSKDNCLCQCVSGSMCVCECVCVCVPESMSLFILVPVHVAAGPCCLLSYAKDILWCSSSDEVGLLVL